MKTFSFQSLTALCCTASLYPALAFEDSVSRQLHIDYSINDTYIDFTDPAIAANGTIIATNYIGTSVNNGSVGTNLLNFGCEFEIDKTGLEVEISNVTEYVQGGLYQWKIQVIPSRLTANAGGLVNYTNATETEHRSVGTIQFCTRVSSWLYDLQVGFRENNYELKFDMRENNFTITGVNVEEDDPDDFDTDVANPFSLSACQCSNFNCVTTPSSPIPIQQDASLVICLTPSSTSDVVEISNFNLRIVDSVAGAVTYDPVLMGASSWDADSLTSVAVDPNSNIVMITAPIIAQFFIQGVQQIDALGNAFLEFAETKNNRAATFASFGLTFDLELVEEDEPGCLDRLFSLFF